MFIRYWIMHVHVCIEYTYSERERRCVLCLKLEISDYRLPLKKNIQTVDAYIITLPTNNTFHRSRWDKNGNMFHSQIHLPEKKNIPKVIFKYLSHGLSSQLGINKKQEPTWYCEDWNKRPSKPLLKPLPQVLLHPADNSHLAWKEEQVLRS